MRFIKECADLNALLEETGLRGNRLAANGRKELRLVMSRKTARAFSVDRHFLPLGSTEKLTIEPTSFGSYYIRGNSVDFNDGLSFGEVLFTEVMP